MSIAEDVAVALARAFVDAAIAQVGKPKVRELLDADSPAVVEANLAADLAEAAKGLK